MATRPTKKIVPSPKAKAISAKSPVTNRKVSASIKQSIPTKTMLGVLLDEAGDAYERGILTGQIKSISFKCEGSKLSELELYTEASLVSTHLGVLRTRDERVAEAKKLLGENSPYNKGCSDFVCKVLGVSYMQANQLMGDSPVPVGNHPPYKGLQPGDIAGWVNPHPTPDDTGHVAVYIGEANCQFIHVQGNGNSPVINKNGYWWDTPIPPDKMLYKSSRY